MLRCDSDIKMKYLQFVFFFAVLAIFAVAWVNAEESDDLEVAEQRYGGRRFGGYGGRGFGGRGFGGYGGRGFGGYGGRGFGNGAGYRGFGRK